MPKLGETVTEGTIGTWLKDVGDAVEFDDPLFEVSTDKVDSEIPSPYDGVLLEILVNAGETVPVGTPLARIGEAGAQAGRTGRPGSGPAAVGTPRAVDAQTGAAPVSRDGAADGCSRRWSAGSPRRTAWTSRPSPAPGVGGRIRREDVEKAIADGGPTAAAAPAARAAPRRGAAPTAAAAPARRRPAADPRDEVVPLSRMRLALAGALKASQTLAASVWTSVEVDFDNVDKVRAEHKDRFKKETGASLSYLPFVSRAIVDALRAFPTVNSSIDIEAKTMTLHPYVNLGIAVDLDQQGLVVPVVKDADSLNMRGIAKRDHRAGGGGAGKEAAQRGHAGLDVHHHQPRPVRQLRVVADHQPAQRRDPVHRRGEAAAGGGRRRDRHPPDGIIGLVYDHRAFDGSTASLFLMHIRDSLEQRDWEAEVG